MNKLISKRIKSFDKIFKKSIETIVEMLTQRGYIFDSITDNILSMKRDSDKIIVILNLYEKVSRHDINDIKEKYKNQHSIIIYRIDITPPAKYSIHLLDTLTRIESFKLSELQYNITKHRLASKHTRLTQEEIKKYIKPFDIDKYPIILTTDPMVRFYNFKEGDIIKIDRTDNTIAFRIVKYD